MHKNTGRNLESNTGIRRRNKKSNIKNTGKNTVRNTEKI